MLVLENFEPDSAEEHEELVWQCWLARNQHYNRSGFSPQQSVFGTTHRMPRSLASDDVLDADALAMDTKLDYQRAHEVRTSALRAHAELDTKLKLQAATRARTRPLRQLARGDWIFVHRKNRLGKSWRQGPGVVVMIAGASTWVAVQGALWKVSAENCIRATDEEKQGIEAVEAFSHISKNSCGAEPADTSTGTSPLRDRHSHQKRHSQQKRQSQQRRHSQRRQQLKSRQARYHQQWMRSAPESRRKQPAHHKHLDASSTTSAGT